MIDTVKDFVLFSGSSHPKFAAEVAAYLGISVGKAFLNSFPDGEISLQIQDNVRGRECYVVQSVALDPNRYLMELLIMVDALKRASAKSIVAVLPYFGYCRQDRRDKLRVPITARLVADLLETAGVNRVLTMDLHAGQIQGFFNVPVDNLYAMPVLTKQYSAEICSSGTSVVVVAPDIGSIKLARSYASCLHVDFAIIDKHRKSSRDVEVINVIGDVTGKIVLLADDMCSTAKTLVSAAKACQEKGAKRIFASITHGLFVGDALAEIENSPIEKIWVSNTIPIDDRLKKFSKVEPVSVAPLFGHAIECMFSHESVSSLYSS